MAIRRVEIRLSTSGFDAAERAFEHLSLTIDKISRKIDELSLKLDKLSNKDVTPTITLKGVTEANAQIDKLNLKMDMLGRKDITPGIDPKTGKLKFSEANFRRIMDETTRKELSALSALASSIGVNKRSGTLSRNADEFMARELARLNRTFGARSAGGNEGGGGFSTWLGAPLGSGSFVSRLGSPAGIGGIAALLGPVSALIDALTGFGVGTIGAGATFGAVKHFQPAMLKPGMSNIDRTLSTVTQSVGPSVGMMMVGLGKFVQGQAPNIAKLFSAALPFIQAFINLLEQAAKIVLPAFTKVMNQMVSSGALKAMSQGFVYLMQGVAGFLVALGPGMKAGALTFRAIADAIRGILYALGVAFGRLGQATGVVYHVIHDWWDKLRHNTAVIFDGIRHEIAHIWDIIFNNTVGLVSHMTRDISNQSHVLWHNIASTYDSIRHDIAFAWDAIWHATITAVSTGIHAVIGWFKGLPGQIVSALKSLGSTLLGLGKTAITDLWDGMKSVAGGLLSWVKNFVSSIWNSVKAFFGIASPSRLFYTAGRDLVLGMENGIKAHAHRAVAAAHSMARRIGGAVGGSGGGSAAAYAHALANRIGWGGQWGAINAIEMREAGWNMHARNPSSGAYGIAQFINGPSEYYQYGGNPNTVSGQVIAFFNYIRQRYGNPNAAWAHELRFGWYDKGGKLPPGLSLALNTTGHDEIHTAGPGVGGGNIYITVQGDTDPDGAAQRIYQKLRDLKRHQGNRKLGLD